MRVQIAPGIRLFFDTEGASLVPDGNGGLRQRPTVILLHGGPGMDHSGWKPRMSPLAEVAQLVYYDHRSQGRSDRRPPDEWTLDHWADDIVRLSDALEIERPIVFGQSFGGMVAQRYIERHPQHPGKVILSSCSPHFALQRKLAAFERRGGTEAREVARAYWADPSPALFEDFLRVCMPLYSTTPQPDRGAPSLAAFDTELLDHWNREELPHVHLLPGLARAACPVLVVGGADDPITPIEDQRDIAAALPAELVRYVEFTGAGHGVWRDRPAEAMALLREFILAPAP
ncbi:alpha/beta fold hydrolase [Pelomonas sp. KK5]|uniref:alpha/beta fold hydrolase n=1 Tax=Pelomonas sp. KK5 TaxID=1855730 RepID=UPI00097C7BEF|nr:alpha/beta hydrolase [Pelomonas sp. KK5]